MYTPETFEQQDLTEVHRLIYEHPLGILITHHEQNLWATHIPFHFDATAKSHGLLRAHVAKANPVWRELDRQQPVLVIFQGPSAYITPNWYPSKTENQKVVPTWNYTAVHVHGHASLLDAGALSTHLEHLVSQNETSVVQPPGQPPIPNWAVSDAPEQYINNLKNHIVGFQLVITKIEAKWKVSQNQSGDNAQGVIDGLNATNKAMAKIVEQSTNKGRQ